MPRWIRFAFPAHVAATAQTYALEYGPDVVSRARPSHPVTVTRSGKAPRISVHTGPLTVEIPTDRFNGFEAALDGRPVMTAGPDTGPYVVDHRGLVYTAAADPQPHVVIEEGGRCAR